MTSRARFRKLWAGLPVLAASLTPAFAGEPYPYTQEWWALRAGDPPGARQVEKDGKLWPPFPRPVGQKQHWVHKYHHAHYWPHPYVCEDRAYLQTVIDQQASGGWASATTLREYHFDPETHALNSVGRDHLRWIISGAPIQHRTVYVSQSTSPDQDALRQASVQQVVQEFQPGANVPVLLRYDRFLGRPAEEIDQLRRLEMQSIPRPRLFIIGNASGGGGGGGGGSLLGGSSGGGAAGGP